MVKYYLRTFTIETIDGEDHQVPSETEYETEAEVRANAQVGDFLHICKHEEGESCQLLEL